MNEDYVRRDPKTIILEAFRLIRNINDTMTPEALVTWAPVLAHNALYAAGLGCLGEGSTFYVEKKEPTTKEKSDNRLNPKELLRQRFGINFDNRVSTRHFLLHSTGGTVSRYPIEFPAKVLIHGRTRNAVAMKKLEWIEIQHHRPTDHVLQADENTNRKTGTFKAIDFWDVMTRVCDEVYMGRYTCSQPLKISPEELATLEFLVVHLRNPTAHVQPNLRSLTRIGAALNAVKTVRDITIRLCDESQMSVAFDADFVKELRSLAS